MKGVRFSKYHKRWEARVTTGSRELLGRFGTQQEAEKRMGRYVDEQENPFSSIFMDEEFSDGLIVIPDKNRFIYRLGKLVGDKLHWLKRR